MVGVADASLFFLAKKSVVRSSQKLDFENLFSGISGHTLHFNSEKLLVCFLKDVKLKYSPSTWNDVLVSAASLSLILSLGKRRDHDLCSPWCFRCASFSNALSC